MFLPHLPAARKALVPVLVPADQLHLATTIDRWGAGGRGGRRMGGAGAGCPLCEPAAGCLPQRNCRANAGLLLLTPMPAPACGPLPCLRSFAWSVTGAVGASVGGVVASRLGVSACFLVVGERVAPGLGA